MQVSKSVRHSYFWHTYKVGAHHRLPARACIAFWRSVPMSTYSHAMKGLVRHAAQLRLAMRAPQVACTALNFVLSNDSGKCAHIDSRAVCACRRTTPWRCLVATDVARLHRCAVATFPRHLSLKLYSPQCLLDIHKCRDAACLRVPQGFCVLPGFSMVFRMFSTDRTKRANSGCSIIQYRKYDTCWSAAQYVTVSALHV